MEIGHVLGLPSKTMRRLRVMALLHDIGKISLPVAIIRKTASLSSHERELIMRHPELGAKILEQWPDFAFCAPIVLAHHERFDGKGYPNHLKADQIPLEASIISVAEAYDDMISPRPYHKQISPSEAFVELKVNAETQFNPNMVTALIKVESKTPVHNKW
jgi:HD-GYP domain-containing protein (c-di-GMP phosphodiesterase class II)